MIRLRPAARRLAREDGIALVMAMIMMGVFAVTAGAVMYYTMAGSGAAASSSASENAYALATAGVSDALSVLSVAGSDTTKVKPQPTAAGDTNSTVLTYASGTVTWGGSYDSSTRTWTIKSIGAVRNPNGPQFPQITRTVTATAVLNGNPPAYSFASLNSACDKHTLIVKSSGTLIVTNAMYINSCNTSHDAFDIFGTGGSISAPAISVVGGWETHSGDTVIVNGVTCSLANANPSVTAAGCPVTGAPVLSDPFAGKIAAPTLGTPSCLSNSFGTAVAYSTHPKLSGAITATQTTFTSTNTSVQTGDYIQIDSEQMLVTGGGGTTTLTVQRAMNGTTAAAHSNGKEMKNVPVSVIGSAASPAPCDIPSGTVTLTPGTYYGGICIGAPSGSDCGSNIGGSCSTTSSATANVTMAPGTYIMAGGGFFVCGSSTLSAPNVLIYNTQDPSNTSGSGALDQILLNTTGAVTIGPQTSGTYAGLTIYQDPALSLAPSTTCDSRSTSTQIDNWDIGLASMASTGANGALGSISGTIYAPGTRSLFTDEVSGTANLAVLTACIFIDGGTSTFNFQPSGLFGVGLGTVNQWGG